ncbi:hypothetical protein HA402_000666 [Bradysia odoriphaga]|nr:hypothetical protein HA402_000666 [Bradysia odoriphaga]
MLSKIIVLIVVAFVYIASGAQFQTAPYQHPDYPGQCYDEETKQPVPVGKAVDNFKGCKWQQCQPDFSFVGSTCAPTGQPTGCTVTKPDLSKSYPKCCPQVICN